jgi:ribosomal protein S18 acetylase RimI-like enzyme
MTLDARRLEELSLNSSAPPGQLLYDGWLLRLQRGKAKRARSVNAIFPSTLPLDEKIAHCERLYAQAGLPALFRITPFVTPAGLDAELERRSYGRFDFTAVESAVIAPPAHGTDAAREVALPEWVEAVGELRGSPRDQREGHRARLESVPLPMRALALEEGGRIVATGLTVIEGGAAGLFDVVTHEACRRRGLGRQLVAALLRRAWAAGARDAYLQVEVGNAAARAMYRSYGFSERYQYWYRGRDGERH